MLLSFAIIFFFTVLGTCTDAQLMEPSSVTIPKIMESKQYKI